MIFNTSTPKYKGVDFTDAKEAKKEEYYKGKEVKGKAAKREEYYKGKTVKGEK